MRRAALALIAALAVAAAGPAAAAPNAQLVASVQDRLDLLGFRDVDAGTLSTAQIAALHLELTGPLPGYGPRWIDLRQTVKAILRWDE